MNNNLIKYLDEILFKEVQIYLYHFPDVDKFYIGFTSKDLKHAHKLHKSLWVDPLYSYLNDEKYQDIVPTFELSVTVDVYGDDIYKLQRKILDKYTTDVSKILNENLEVFGY